MITIASYLTYLFITVLVTIGVGRSLFRNGRAFLVDAFGGNTALADSINHLLIVGFYLINIGYVCVALKMQRPEDIVTAIEVLSGHLGKVLLVLGFMHIFNIYIFSRIRRSALLNEYFPQAAATTTRIYNQEGA